MKATIHRANSREEYWSSEGCHILEYLNSPEDPNLSLARARVAPGVKTALHRLEGVTERYHLLAGRGVARLGSVETRELSAGDSVTIPAGVDQQIRNTGESDLVFLCICTPRFVPECYVAIEPAESAVQQRS